MFEGAVEELAKIWNYDKSHKIHHNVKDCIVRKDYDNIYNLDNHNL